MPQTHDRVRYVLPFPATNIDQMRVDIVQALLQHGGSVAIIRTGWAQDGPAGTNITALEIEFTVPKNSMTDQEMIDLANEIGVIVGSPPLTIGKMDMESLP